LTIEALEIEATLGLTLPQTKVVCVFGSVAWSEQTIRHGNEAPPNWELPGIVISQAEAKTSCPPLQTARLSAVLSDCPQNLNSHWIS